SPLPPSPPLQNLNRYHLQLDRVAVFGHSFGAYTALALAGARINFDQLRQDCQPGAMLLDLSLLLQCRALELDPAQVPELKDDRIAALILADPVGRSLFGPRELGRIHLPLLWSGAQRDPLTPLVLSQVPAFRWLGSEDKYFAVAEAASHLHFQRNVGAAIHGQGTAPPLGIQSLQAWIAPPPPALQDYTNALGLAFLHSYLLQDDRYRPYLQPGYAQQLSQAPYHLRLLSPAWGDRFSEFHLPNQTSQTDGSLQPVLSALEQLPLRP
ncbi:MAG: hypothetical protein HC824_12880, partial [Synechococcales cyanobacterium RM1_1_8]|nr:hypothetical protein [Synechococcales cyanobacterium RM1_1_8]